MLNEMIVNFYLRKSTREPLYGSVNVRILVNNERITLGAVSSVSGLKLPKSMMIKTAHWNSEEEMVSKASPHALVLNRAIDACKTRLHKLYLQHEGFDMTMTAQGVKDLFLGLSNVRPSFVMLCETFLEERKSIGTKTSTLNTYRFKFRPLLEFLEVAKLATKPAEDFGPDKLQQYRVYLIAKRNNQARSADKACQVVKTVLLWAAGSGRIKTNPLINTRIHVDKTPNLTCLTQDEVKLLIKADLNEAMRVIADCFIFACYTGTAYQDMMNLTRESIQLVEGRSCLVGNRQKSSTPFTVPLTAPVWNLIGQYGLPMPAPGNREYNLLLKSLMKIVGIKKHVSSHTGRKTFADWCINELGMSDEATTVAMGQKDPSELTPYRRIRPKRLMMEFPEALMQGP